MKAVIPAAGFGTRFLPITKAQPKEMLPVGDKPAIQYVVEEAVNSGIDDILIITGRGKRAIEDHFDRSAELERMLKEKGDLEALEEIEKISNLADIHYIRQKTQAGLGDAILCAKKHVGDEPFAVMLGDTITVDHTPCIKKLMAAYDDKKASVIGVEEVPAEKVNRYGIVWGKQLSENLTKLDGLVEKPDPKDAPSNLAIFGRYILTPAIFDCLEQTQAGFGGEIQLTDALSLLLKQEDIYASIVEGRRFDIGNKVDWLLASLELSLDNDKFIGLRNHLQSVIENIYK